MFGGEIVKKNPFKIKFGLRKSLVQDREPRQGPRQSWTWKIFTNFFFFPKALKMSCLMEKL